MVKKTRRVEIRYRSTNFPTFCPVCDAPVTTEGTIPAFTRAQRERGKTMNGWAFTSSRVVASTRELSMTEGVNYLAIPVCDHHQFSFQETKHVRGVFSILTTLLVLLTIGLVMSILAGFLNSGVINTSTIFILSLSIIGSACTYSFGRPTALERSVSVYDMTPDMTTVILDIASVPYAEELLRMNPMTAKGIGKIVGRNVGD